MKAKWSEVEATLREAVREVKLPYGMRSKYASWFVHIYWINNRFDEARAVTRYWCQASEENIVEHQDEARSALKFIRKQKEHMGAVRRASESERLHLKWPKAPPRFKHNHRLLGKFRDYRTSHIIMGILEWTSDLSQDETGWVVARLDVDKNPMWPLVPPATIYCSGLSGALTR